MRFQPSGPAARLAQPQSIASAPAPKLALALSSPSLPTRSLAPLKRGTTMSDENGEDTYCEEMEARLAVDPHLRAEVERAIAPYRAIVPAWMIRSMRAGVTEVLTEGPYFTALLDRLRPA